MFELHFGDEEYSSLRDFLLASAPREQAAFVYFDVPNDGADSELAVRQVERLTERDFVVRASDYLEITDETRQRVIKTAHDCSLAVAEFHSHPFDLPAEFSVADRIGLQDTVPHMLWRLKRRPYVAVVVGPRDFDGLVWLPDHSVSQLTAIVSDESRYSATGRSLRPWQ